MFNIHNHSHLEDTTLPCSDEIVDAKVEEIGQAFLDSLDEYIGAQVVVLGRNAEPVLARVKNRKYNSSGNPVGNINFNQVLDLIRVYKLEFSNGRIEEYSVNMIV